MTKPTRAARRAAIRQSTGVEPRVGWASVEPAVHLTITAELPSRLKTELHLQTDFTKAIEAVMPMTDSGVIDPSKVQDGAFTNWLRRSREQRMSNVPGLTTFSDFLKTTGAKLASRK